MQSKFWYVYNPGGYRPQFKHTTEYSATEEARRLARQSPGQEFIVLEAKRILKSEQPVTEIELLEVPF